jgi:RNA polymerase sigma-70 factor (family 1)
LKEISIYDEAQVLRSLAKGSEYAFTQLVHRYQARVFAAAFQILKSRENAQEIVQEVFCKVWTDREPFLRAENHEAYIFVMARNLALKFLRRLYNERSRQFQFTLEHSRVDTTAEHLLQEREYTEILKKTLDLLPPQQKQVYYLSKFEYMSHEEIAQKMSISAWTVSNHMKSALKFIRQRLDTVIGFNALLVVLRIFDL